MPTYTFYRPDGVITGQTVCSEDEISINLREGQEYVEGDFDGNHLFIVDGVATNKQEMEPVVDGHNITNLPFPCVIRIEASRYEVYEDHVELDFSMVGPYRVMVSAIGYYDKELVIE